MKTFSCIIFSYISSRSASTKTVGLIILKLFVVQSSEADANKSVCWELKQSFLMYLSCDFLRQNGFSKAIILKSWTQISPFSEPCAILFGSLADQSHALANPFSWRLALKSELFFFYLLIENLQVLCLIFFKFNLEILLNSKAGLSFLVSHKSVL